MEIWKNKNFSFFCNKKCEYYPCHNEEELNCLFCYCPLYILPDCGGNYTMYGDIKDCSGCTIPHRKENYGYITEKYKDILEMMKMIGN